MTDLLNALMDREKEILADIQVAREELEEGKPLAFAFTFSSKLLLDKNQVETAFSYSVKKSQKETHQLPQPDPEPELWKEGA